MKFKHILLGLLASLATTSGFAQTDWDRPFVESRFSFESTPGRLAKFVRPTHYDLSLEPSADARKFNGEVTIKLDVNVEVVYLQLNALELQVQSAVLKSAKAKPRELKAQTDNLREFLTLTPVDAKAIARGGYELQIKYTGKLSDRPIGMYRVPFVGADGKTDVVIATQFEPSYARRMLPLWDEPVYRATFAVSTVVAERLKAVSNMPITREEALGNGKKRVHFATSPGMSSYLLAVFVGPFDVLEDKYKNTALRIYTVPGKADRGRYAMEVTKQVMAEFEDYFGVPYTLPKLDQVAVPGGAGGAMENWGAISYNEAALLWQPTEGAVSQRRVYSIIAHEIAHQWFGNLVTMAWWDNLWLNEGFASWMAGRTTAKFNAAWDYGSGSVNGREGAMYSDGIRTTHPIQTPVADESQALGAFDAITYNKGEAFIRMLEAWVGADAFRNGIRSYMREHALSNTTTADLWHHLSKAAGKDVTEMAAGWTRQPGYPLLRVGQVCKDGKSTVSISQQRFSLTDPRARQFYWVVPVTLAGYDGLRKAQLSVPRDGKPVSVSLPGCDPVLADPSDEGYYRIAYEAELGAAHRARLASLPEPKQVKLLLDAYSLAQQGTGDMKQYLALVESLSDKASAGLWSQAVGQLRSLQRVLRNSDIAAHAKLASRIHALLAPALARSGWRNAANESPVAAQLRERLIETLAETGHAQTLESARLLFKQWQTEPALLSGTLRGAVLNAAGVSMTGADYAWAWEKMKQARSVQERRQLQSMMRYTQDKTLFALFLDMMLADKELSSSEVAFNISNAAEHNAFGNELWAFVMKNHDAIEARAGRYGINDVAPGALRTSTNTVRADELERFARARSLRLDTVDGNGAALTAAEGVRLRADIAERLKAAL